MRLLIQRLHEGTDLLLVELGEVARPVILVAKTPDDYRGMIVVLVDHVSQHAFRLPLVALPSQSAAAPWDLLPDQQTQLVAAIEHGARLLIMAQPDEVCSHLFDQRHLFANEILGHRRAEQSVILVALRAPDEESLAIELERAVLEEFEVPKAKPLDHLHLSLRSGQSDFASVQSRL